MTMVTSAMTSTPSATRRIKNLNTRASQPLEARIQGVAHPVAKDVERQRGYEQG
jgi:hypothetical protein